MINSIKSGGGLIVLAGIAAYGLQVPFLGFFQDDWNFVYYYILNGTQGLMDLMTIDGRPGGVWVYALAFKMLGYNTALWQLFSITFRTMTAITIWLILVRFWPERKNGNLIAAILFLLYPFFTLQPLSISFAQHYVAYFLLGLSFLFTIRSIENPEKYLNFTIPAVLFTFAHLFTVEYFVGLELLRPFVIWHFINRRQGEGWKMKLVRTGLAWLPYLLPLVFFVLWRSLFLSSLGIRNNPLNVLTDSGNIVLSVLQYMTADLVLMLGSSWANLINPELFVLGPIRNLYIAASSLVGGAGFFFLMKGRYQIEENKSVILQVLLFGGIVIAAGMLPAYSIGYILNNKLPPWNSRFSLPALLGLALVISELITIITSQKNRLVLISILMGLIIGHHNFNTLNFKSAWEKQERFYQQLLWRAPSLSPGTGLISSEEFLGYMGDYPTSMGINAMYESNSGVNVPYWFFILSDPNTAQAVPNNGSLAGTKNGLSFIGQSANAIFIVFEPENDQCLWVLRPEDGDLKQLPGSMKNAVALADLSRIQMTEGNRSIYNRIVNEDRATWCFFYQKADLARQYGEWESVIEYWNEAESQGYRPRHGFEYIPFIEGYAFMGDWEKAFQLTRTADKTTKGMYFILCPIWERISKGTTDNGMKDEFVNKAKEQLQCSQ